MPYHLQCDKDDCRHTEDVEIIDETMIGKPCPKCGSNLLTKEDFIGFLAIYPKIQEMEAAAVEALAVGLGSNEGMALVQIGFKDNEPWMTVEVPPERKS